MPRVHGCCNNTSLKVQMFICCGFRKCRAHLDTPLNSISFSSLCSLLSRKFCSIHFIAGWDEKEEQAKMWPFKILPIIVCVCSISKSSISELKLHFCYFVVAIVFWVFFCVAVQLLGSTELLLSGCLPAYFKRLQLQIYMILCSLYGIFSHYVYQLLTYA